MKKKIAGCIAVVAIAMCAAFNVNINTQENGASEISLANIEALAQENSGSNLCNTYCTNSQSYHCQGKNSSMTFTCYYMRKK